jgi:hypothetical protein
LKEQCGILDDKTFARLKLESSFGFELLKHMAYRRPRDTELLSHFCLVYSIAGLEIPTQLQTKLLQKADLKWGLHACLPRL